MQDALRDSLRLGSKDALPFDQPAVTETEHVEPARPNLIVVGNGVVGQRFCERAIELQLHQHYRITIFGEEPHAAYDRVHLTKLLRGGTLEQLTLRDRGWYQEHGIELCTSTTVHSLDLEHRRVISSSGTSHPFDDLVLATGSRALRPKLPGSDLQHAYVYRTADDLFALQRRVARCQGSGLPAVVVGAGLLGLEAAEALMELGLEVRVLEAADFLLPRQLDRTSATAVATLLQRRGFQIRVGTRLQSIAVDDQLDALTLTTSDEERLSAALVVFAIGIRPRDELAKEAGIHCDLFGGVEIDEQLQTSVPHVYAIGECAHFRGHSYGLVAPGHAMAEALAERLAGEPSQFAGSELQTRLKVGGFELSVIGESSSDDVECRILTYQDETHLRRLVLRGRHLVGGTVIGEWNELPALQDAVVQKREFKPRHERRFQAQKAIWGAAAVSLATWPDTAVVCTCTGATCGTLRRARAQGCGSVQALTARTGAGSVCGSCTPLLGSLISGGSSVAAGRVAGVTLSAALLCLLAVLVTLLCPAIAFSTHSESAQALEALWRDSTLKQITGFTLLGLGLLESSIALRKRIGWIKWGRFTSWRAFHTLLGCGLLVLLCAHTGFRLGHNLDRWLILTLLFSSLLGALAAVLVAVEPKFLAQRIPALRGAFAKLHLWLLWPLPVLVAAHVVKVYFF